MKIKLSGNSLCTGKFGAKVYSGWGTNYISPYIQVILSVSKYYISNINS